MIKKITQDWAANHGNKRSQIVLISFRLAQILHRLPSEIRWLAYPYFLFYEIMIIWGLGIELSYKATIGSSLRLFHGVGTVVHESVIIGNNVTLRHCTTLGMRKDFNDVPVLGNNIDIGCNCVMMGAIRIGDGATIGAGSVVLHDVPAGAVVAGNPAKVIR